MFLWLEIEGRRLPDRAHELVVVLVRPHGHVIERHIGDRSQLGLDGSIHLPFRLLAGLNELLEFSHFRHKLLGGVLVLRCLGLADLLGGRIAARLGLLQAGQMTAARIVHFNQFGRRRLETTAPQSLVERVRIFTNPFDIKHGLCPLNAAGFAVD